MNIREDSKKIITYFLHKAIKQGDLRAHFLLQYDELANALNLESVGYCRVCCQYLLQKGCIKSYEESTTTRSLELCSSAIDFMEQG